MLTYFFPKYTFFLRYFLSFRLGFNKILHKVLLYRFLPFGSWDVEIKRFHSESIRHASFHSLLRLFRTSMFPVLWNFFSFVYLNHFSVPFPYISRSTSFDVSVCFSYLQHFLRVYIYQNVFPRWIFSPDFALICF